MCSVRGFDELRPVPKLGNFHHLFCEYTREGVQVFALLSPVRRDSCEQDPMLVGQVREGSEGAFTELQRHPQAGVLRGDTSCKVTNLVRVEQPPLVV